MTGEATDRSYEFFEELIRHRRLNENVSTLLKHWRTFSPRVIGLNLLSALAATGWVTFGGKRGCPAHSSASPESFLTSCHYNNRNVDSLMLGQATAKDIDSGWNRPEVGGRRKMAFYLSH